MTTNPGSDEEEFKRLVESRRRQRECPHEHLRLPEDDFCRIVRKYVECADCEATVGRRMQKVVTLCYRCSSLPITKWYPIVTKIVLHNTNFARLECPRCLGTSVLHSRIAFDEGDDG